MKAEQYINNGGFPNPDEVDEDFIIDLIALGEHAKRIAKSLDYKTYIRLAYQQMKLKVIYRYYKWLHRRL